MRNVLILSTVLLAPTSAHLINVTIDDTFGDPTTGQQILYFPSDAWQQGNGCQPCTAKPTPASDAWLDTWHDATFNPNDTATNSALGQIIEASVQFTGTAVYVNCILTRSSSSPDGNSDMTFFVDDTMAGVFQQTPNGDTTYHFDVPVFAATGLANAQHNVRLESGHAGKKALVLLDSIVYTTDDGLGDPSPTGTSTEIAPSTASSSPPQSNTNRKTNIGVIVGPIIAALVAVIGFIAGVLIFLKRRRDGKNTRSSIDGPSMITPFGQQPPHMQQTQAPSSMEGSTYQGSVSFSSHIENSTSSTIANVSRTGKKFPGKREAISSATENGRPSRPLPSTTEDARRAALTSRIPSTPSRIDSRL